MGEKGRFNGKPSGVAVKALRLGCAALFLCVVLAHHNALAQESACARVKMEVAQELTLERQAFDAHMRVNNGMDGISLENVGVEVSFFDAEGRTVRASANPNDAEALFFIRLSSMEHITRVDGHGSVAPKTSADIHWLIIPAQGASRGAPSGTLYQVGATLTYTLGGESHATTVAPDTILVKPMPQLALDYFLPTDVTADDPFTAEVEPPVPFSLGARVANRGSGTAHDLTIESAQPKILSNEQGLPIEFAITGCEVNGQAAARSLLVDFGDLPPAGFGTARWTMTCPLSGQFVELKADFTHADELGGALTSLITSVDTHLLVHDVLVDLPGRDSIRDFLARDGDTLRVYESHGVDTVVMDLSPGATLQLVGQTGPVATYSLTVPPTDGVMLVRIEDPTRGARRIKEIVRSDGKRIKPENSWQSRRREDAQTLRYTLSLFDCSTTGSYRIELEDPAFQSSPPVLEAIPDRTGVEGQTLSFPVAATDPDGTIPTLSASPIPALASFADRGDGSGLFQWTPASGQAGRYEITYTASDGALKATRRAALTICSTGDSDCDGMADSWELACFGTLQRDGKGDWDGDGVSDFDEYWRNTDPTRSNAPTTPIILSPQDKGEVAVLNPQLTVQNGVDPDPMDPVTHTFELFAEPGLVSRIDSAEGLFAPGTTTTWAVPLILEDNKTYFWRVRASDGRNHSEWAYGSFKVNSANDAPSGCTVSSPRHGAEVDTQSPRLEVSNGIDPDGDPLLYGFEIYADEGLSTLIDSRSNLPEGPSGVTAWTVSTPLANHRSYFWTATVTDAHGARSATPLATFAVNAGNTAPTTPGIVFPAAGAELDFPSPELVCANSTDADGDPLAYTFQVDTVSTFNGPGLLTSGPIPQGPSVTRWIPPNLSDNTEYHWRVRAGDGTAESAWASGSFFVNTANEAPSTPTLKNPGDGSWVQTLTPTLQLNPAADPDRDALTYRFEICRDAPMLETILLGEASVPEWTVPVELADNSRCFWRGRARDEHGAESPWTSAASFFVNNNGVDDPPEIVIVAPASDVVTRGGELLIAWRDADPDSSADITLGISLDGDPASAWPIASGIQEDDDGHAGTYLWDISGVPDGVYWIHAAITDGSTTRSAVAPGRAVIDRTPPTVRAEPPGGFHETPQRVTLTADEPAAIYYTLDGSEPTTSSPATTGPIRIDGTTTLRHMAVDTAGNPSPVSDEVYTIQSVETLDHFDVTAPSAVQSGLGFVLTVRALGPSGGVVERFNEPVTLTPSGGSISPTSIEGFNKGIWTGEAVIAGSSGHVAITASRDAVLGVSAPILVTCHPPRPPIPDQPGDGERITPEVCRFSWHPVPGATSYGIEIADHPAFDSPLFVENGIPTPSLTPPDGFIEALDRQEVYYWRVQAANACGSGEYSEARRFRFRPQERARLDVLSPRKGDILRSGSQHRIRWSYTGKVGSTVRITLEIPGKRSTVLASGVRIKRGSFPWKVVSGPHRGCRILIESEQNPRAAARSSPFDIR